MILPQQDFQPFPMCTSSSGVKPKRRHGISIIKDSMDNNVNGSKFSGGQSVLDSLWRDAQQLMERSEQLVRLMTHVCSHRVTGVFRSQQTGFSSKCCSNHSCEASSVDTKEDLIGENKEKKRRGTSWPLNPLPWSRPTISCGWNSNSYWERYHTFPKWRRLFPYGERGSGAGPPYVVSSLKKKQSSPNAPSSTKPSLRPSSAPSILTILLLLVATLARVTESCSSRSTPKPRPASPTLRPNVTFQTYACPPAYAAWYCLNGATCFTVKIQDAILYNCECAEGYMGPRCEFKDLDGSYLPARERVLLETASIAGGACIAIVLVFVVLFVMYVFMHKDREKRRALDNPFHDQRPLSDSISQGPEYICTITAIPTSHTNIALSTGEDTLHHINVEEKTKGLYLVRGIGSRSLCTCEQRDLSGHVACIMHSQKFIFPTKVPNYV